MAIFFFMELKFDLQINDFLSELFPSLQIILSDNLTNGCFCVLKCSWHDGLKCFCFLKQELKK